MSGVYCSRSCANSRRWSEANKAKRSVDAKARYTGMSEDGMAAFKAQRKAAAPQAVATSKRNRLAKLIASEWMSLSRSQKKRRVILEQSGSCNGCQQSTWRGRPLVFELEHKDGNRYNDARVNLEVLCPNCHSQTPTWRGRKGAHKGITDAEMMFQVVHHNGKVKPALMALGLNSGRDNRERAKRLFAAIVH